MRNLKPTYEGLKDERKASYMRKNSRFKAYLWGIERQYRYALIVVANKFKAYLWGIESINLKIAQNPPTSDLKPTYEGLKDRWYVLVMAE